MTEKRAAEEIVARAVHNLEMARANGCWDDHQVYAFLNDWQVMTKEEMRHLKGCVECRRSIMTAYPNREWLDRVLEEAG